MALTSRKNRHVQINAGPASNRIEYVVDLDEGGFKNDPRATVVAQRKMFRLSRGFCNVSNRRKNDIMAHLMDALSQGKVLGLYGKLVFVMLPLEVYENTTEHNEEKVEAQGTN